MAPWLWPYDYGPIHRIHGILICTCRFVHLMYRPKKEVIRSKVMVTVTSVFSLSDQRSRWPWTQKACLIGKLNAWTYRLQTWHWGWSWLWYDCTLILLSPGDRLRSWWPLTYKSLFDWYQENTWTYSHQIFAGRWAGLVDGPIWFEVSGKRSRSWWPLTKVCHYHKYVLQISCHFRSCIFDLIFPVFLTTFYSGGILFDEHLLLYVSMYLAPLLKQLLFTNPGLAWSADHYIFLRII